MLDIRREILRNVVLCQALEPLAKKPGLTHRLQDATSGAKLEYFIVAGVNSCWMFYDLADRVLQKGSQPDCIFDLAYEAQAASVRNRLGSKVNYGQISLLLLLVTAQVLEFIDTGSYDNVEAVLRRTQEVLRNTTEKDVEFVEKFIHLGYEQSARHHERVGDPKSSRPPVLKGRYTNLRDSFLDYQQIHIVREMSLGYPNTLQVYRYLLHNLEEGILHGSEMIYRVLLAELQHADAVADMLVAGLYLTLMSHPESVLFT